ncbi:MAG: hypothetical protein KAJ05_12550, partial [Candidatus Latescibacteria bacterium]|nr:hypothetical protein [Candidatus Latescibacterota bacterium]
SCFFDKVFPSNRRVRQVGAESAKKEAHFAIFAPSLSALRLWFDCTLAALWDQRKGPHILTYRDIGAFSDES